MPSTGPSSPLLQPLPCFSQIITDAFDQCRNQEPSGSEKLSTELSDRPNYPRKIPSHHLLHPLEAMEMLQCLGDVGWWGWHHVGEQFTA